MPNTKQRIAFVALFFLVSLGVGLVLQFFLGGQSLVGALSGALIYHLWERSAMEAR